MSTRLVFRDDIIFMLNGSGTMQQSHKDEPLP